MRILRYGDAGLYVRYLQLALARAGYDDVQIDGVFGAKTLNAVTDFQKVNGLDADGVVGRPQRRHRTIGIAGIAGEDLAQQTV